MVAVGLALLGCLLGFAGNALAWENHTVSAYRAFERMPEVVLAPPVAVETLESFLKAEERTLEALLESQEAWARANLKNYPSRPAKLAFMADPNRSDEARRLAFVAALRVAPTARWALFVQPDPYTSAQVSAARTYLPHSAVSTLPASLSSTQRFVPLRPGELVPALQVLATACDEPDYGLDINLWSDSPSEWGKTYGFGKLPFGNPALAHSSQGPFHMGFMHESELVALAAPFTQRTFPRLRHYQYASLAALAFRTGHPYWGWRFAGLSLHYLQDLTQPYHAILAPGHSTAELLTANALAMVGFPRRKDDIVMLLSNRHTAMERYQIELQMQAARERQDTSLEKTLRNTERDRNYPEWNDKYITDVVSAQAVSRGPALVSAIVAALPAAYVSDPQFDFGANDTGISLINELSQRDPADRARLDAAITELLGNFGAHSRNGLRAILKASIQP